MTPLCILFNGEFWAVLIGDDNGRLVIEAIAPASTEALANRIAYTEWERRVALQCRRAAA